MTGNGIQSITKTGTSGLVDTYTIIYTNGNTTTFTVTNGEDANITRTEFEELKQENEDLKKNQLTNTPTPATSHYLQDSADSRFRKFIPIGRTTQESTTGKQLLEKLINTPKSNGAKYSTDRLSVEVDFANSSDEYFSILMMESPTTKTYTLAFEASGVKNGENPRYSLWDGSSYFILKNGRNVVVISNGTKIKGNKILLDDQSKSIYPNTSKVTFTNFMLVEGEYTEETMPDYEPYTGGEPAPNPIYPFPIKNTGDNGSVNEKVSNSDGTQQQNISFPLSQGQKLYEGEELKDNGKDDIWREKILDGTEDWQYVNGQFVIYGINYLKYSDGGKCYSSHFIGSAIDNLINVNLHMWIGNNTFILCQYDDITSLEDWKTFLAEQYAKGTPVTVVYKKAEPTITPYTEGQQQYYDEHIKPLRTYKNVTHISSEDETPANVEVEYVRDLETVINNLSN